MAFNIDEFFQAAQSDDTTTIKRGTEEFKFRRMNGVERLRFNDLTTQYDRVVYVLSRCLLTGDAARPIGEQNAVKFIERFPGLADALFGDIFETTLSTLENETAIWQAAKKNSPTPTDTKSESANTVADTV